MISSSDELNACTCCGNEKLNLISSFDSIDTNIRINWFYCPECTNAQFSEPASLSNNITGLRRMACNDSSDSNDYFEWFSQYIILQKIAYNKHPMVPGVPTILHIDCKDGELLNFFPEEWKKIGTESNEALAEIASKKDINIIVDQWNSKTVKKLKNFIHDLPIDVIVSRNTISYVKNPLDFLINCANIMNEESDLYIQILTPKSNEYYHSKNVSFINTKSMKRLVERAGLFLNDVMSIDIHGINYVFTINKIKMDDSWVLKQIEEESKVNLYRPLIWIEARNEKTI